MEAATGSVCANAVFHEGRYEAAWRVSGSISRGAEVVGSGPAAQQ